MMSDKNCNSQESGAEDDGLQVAIPAPRKYPLSSSSLLPVHWAKIDFSAMRPYNRPERDESDYDFKTVVFNQSKQIEVMLKMQAQQLRQNEALREHTDTAITQLRSDLETRNALIENRVLLLEARAWESGSETYNSQSPSPTVRCSEALELPSNQNLPFNIVHVQGAEQNASSRNNNRCPYCAKVFSTAKYTKLHIRSICRLTPLDQQDISQRCRRAEKKLCLLCRKSYGGNYILRHKCNFSFGFN